MPLSFYFLVLMSPLAMWYSFKCYRDVKEFEWPFSSSESGIAAGAMLGPGVMLLIIVQLLVALF